MDKAGREHIRPGESHGTSDPEGHHTITPHLVIKGASEAIEFYKQAFGAKEISRMPFPSPDGQIVLGHAELQIGDSRLFLADEFPRIWLDRTEGRFARDDPPVCHGCRCHICPGRQGAGATSAHANSRHVLGRPLRPAYRSLWAPS